LTRGITRSCAGRLRKLNRVVSPEATDGEQVEILPLTVMTRSFVARPSSLPDVRDFVRRQLTGSPVTDDDVRRLCDRVADVLLDAAGVSWSIQVSLRIFPDSAEVDVVFATERIAPPAAGAVPISPAPRVPAPVTPAPDATVPAVPALSFAAWFAGRLRREGLTMEAAARRLDVSAKTISRWVAGSTEPRLRDLLRIREIFGEPPIH
jgi:hypothetical protein